MTRYTYIIHNSGVGGFLNPPNHAEHEYSVRSYTNGRLDGIMSLSTAASESYVWDYLTDTQKQTITELLNWELVITEEWEHTVYNYFRNCWSPDGVNRNVDKCKVYTPTYDSDLTLSLAYLFIRRFFPDYEPNEYLIFNNGDKGLWSKEN